MQSFTLIATNFAEKHTNVLEYMLTLHIINLVQNVCQGH